jgi:hypothetical protein
MFPNSCKNTLLFTERNQMKEDTNLNWGLSEIKHRKKSRVLKSVLDWNGGWKRN